MFESDIPWCGSAMCLIRTDMSAAAGSWLSPVCVGISGVACWLVWSVCVNLSTEGSTSYQCLIASYNLEACQKHGGAFLLSIFHHLH